MFKSLHRTLRIKKLFTVSLSKLERRFFITKTNEKGGDSGLNQEKNKKENLENSQKQNQPDKANPSQKEEASTDQLNKTFTDSALNFMATGLSEQLRSRNQPIDELILMDHLDLKAFLQKFEQSNTFAEATQWLHQFIWEISRHSIAEEIIMYPMLKKVQEGKEKWNESLDDHRKIKEILSHVHKIKDLTELKAKVKEASDILLRHIEFEEKEVLPAITKQYMTQDLIIEGNRFLRRKMIAPTRPHNMAPDSIPTLESLVGMMISPIDKFRDLFFVSFPDQNEVDRIKKENTKNPKH